MEISTRGIPEAVAYIKSVGYMSQRKVAEWVSEYLIGDENHGLRHSPPYKAVSRKAAYGQTFQSDKQRRWFFWALHSGVINPWQDNRTGEQANAWQSRSGAANSWIISNTSKSAKWTMGNTTQARQPAMVGWRKMADVISSNMSGAIRHASAMLAQYLKGK